MVSKLIRTVRCEDLLTSFMEGGKTCVFFTLTTPDVVDLHQIRARWRALRHYLVEFLPNGCKYVMNFEIHPKGHGWHIHSVWNCVIPLKGHLEKIRSFGFGRVDVRLVDSVGVADYLSKHALKAYRGVSRREMMVNPSFRLRLVNTSRGLPRLSDYKWQGQLKDDVQLLMRRLSFHFEEGHRTFFSGLSFYEKWQLCELLVLLGVSASETPRRDAFEKIIEVLNGAIDTDHILEYIRNVFAA